MNFNKSLVLFSLLALIFLSIGAVSANENDTLDNNILNLEDNPELEYENGDLGLVEEQANDAAGQDNIDEYCESSNGEDIISEDSIVSDTINYDDTSSSKEKVSLSSKNITMYYDDITAEIEVFVLDNNGKRITGLNVLLNGKIAPDYHDNKGYQFYMDYLPVGTHFFKISLNSDKYESEPITVSVKILKSKPTVTVKKWYTTTDQYFKLKAEIEDKDRSGWIDEGTVTFKIGKKSYTVKVNGGDAIKKIRLKKAGVYKFTATFKSKNHYTKTAKGKIYVYSTSKKARTFKIKEYKVVIPKNKYKKLINAKNTNKVYYFQLKTKKYVKQTYVTCKKTKKWVLYKRNAYPSGYYYESSKYKVKNCKKIWIDDGVYDLVADIYKKVTKTKKIYKTKTARVYIEFDYGGKKGSQGAPAKKYVMRLSTKYQNPGYDLTSGWVTGWKKSSYVDTLKKAKTRK